MSAAEQFVLGGLMLIGDLSSDQAQRVLAMLSPASFASPDHALIFSAMRNLADRNGGADPFTVEAEAKRDGRYRDSLGDYLLELATSTPSAANLTAYAEAVREEAVERFAMNQMNQAIALLGDKANGDIYKRLGLAESVLNAIQERAIRNRTQGLRHAKDIGKEWVADVENRVQGRVRGFTIGIEALDHLLKPKRVPAGSLVVIGARPKMGKTAVLGHIAKHYAFDRKEAVAVFSLEMPEAQIYERLIVDASGVDPEIFYRAAKDADDWGRVAHAADRFNRSQLHIDDTPGIRLSHIQREARKLNRQHKVGLVAVDYLTLMEAEDAERNDLAYGRITKGLKNLAKELDCVVLLLSQLNRQLENRPAGSRRPMPSDSRDTGQIEQDCDLWIGLYRDAVYNPDAPEALSEAIVRLNRHGKTGTAYFNLTNGAVVEVDQEQARLQMDIPERKPRRVEL